MTDWTMRLIEEAGYVGIFLLMFLENVFPPLPSEVIMPMAGYSASEGRLALAGVLATGTGGTLAGAMFWYFVAKGLGEAGLKRWAARHGRWITLSPSDVERLDRWFDRRGSWTVPAGHFVPGVRTLISIPAGIFGMGFARFVLLTSLGAGAWTSVLGLAGYALGSRFDQVDRYLGPIGTAVLLGLLAWYFYRVVTFNRRREHVRGHKGRPAED